MAKPAGKLLPDESLESTAESNPPTNIIDFNQARRQLRQSQLADKREKTEPEIAQQYAKGAPMQGVSQTAGLTGGTKDQEDDKKTAAAGAQAGASSGAKVGQQIGQIPGQATQAAGKGIGKAGKGIKEAGKKSSKFGRELKKRGLAQRLAQKKGGPEGMATESAQGGTGQILKAAWRFLIASWGTTWFYIAFHFIMAYFTSFSNLFCKFGEEWIPKPIKKGPAKEAVKMATKPLELAEICGCVLIGIILAIIVFIIILSFGTLAYIYAHPVDAIKTFASAIWDIIKTMIRGIME